VTAVALAFTRRGATGAVPLLLGGSLGTTHTMWEPQLRGLGERVDTVAFDHRGHGASPVPDGPYTVAELGGDVLALMDSLGLERAAYCGLSLGGMVGQWLAINAPQRIERLILICTAPHLPPAAGWLERAATVRRAGSVEPVIDAVLARWFTAAFAAQHPDLVARVRAMIATSPPEGYAACCEAIADYDVRAGLPSITAPTLIIAGAQDPAAPPAIGRDMAAAVPGSRFALLDPAAHLASAERPGEVNYLIGDHLDQGEP
jgi:3-oxoadipate enol-lactonase